MEEAYYIGERESLFRKAAIELRGRYRLIRCDGVVPVGAVVLAEEGVAAPDSAVVFGRDLPCSFAPGSLLLLLTEGRLPLVFDEKEAVVSIEGRAVRLTEVEKNLFSVLLRAGGEFVPREELIREVWSGQVDGGNLNVYIHYLREKLESGGERVILSSRKLGYRISEKYAGRDEHAHHH